MLVKESSTDGTKNYDILRVLCQPYTQRYWTLLKCALGPRGCLPWKPCRALQIYTTVIKIALGVSRARRWTSHKYVAAFKSCLGALMAQPDPSSGLPRITSDPSNHVTVNKIATGALRGSASLPTLHCWQNHVGSFETVHLLSISSSGPQGVYLEPHESLQLSSKWRLELSWRQPGPFQNCAPVDNIAECV